MQFDGALITEQGVTFAIIVVKSHVLSNPMEKKRMQIAGAQIFHGAPIVLMAQDSRGIPKYLGRPDIVKFLAKLSISQIPWKRYTIT